ncbi:hypothetical protein [Geothrix oryzisoli]|uniref:hypothetical protein n=1 Tax=Geothrix oryzisoli TaxID=2922721 RepID=UPI001FAD5048|nr:hypothetical protein [Geothrix oryzisoli]
MTGQVKWLIYDDGAALTQERGLNTLLLESSRLPRNDSGLIDYALLAQDLLVLADREVPGRKFQWIGMVGGERVLLLVIIRPGGVVGIHGACLDSGFARSLAQALESLAPDRLDLQYWCGWDTSIPGATEYLFGEASLLLGMLPIGLEQKELRLSMPAAELPDPCLEYSCPRWNGDLFIGKTLVITWSHGFGDVLQFVRFIPMVKARGGRVLLLAQRELAGVVGTCPGVDQVIPQGDPIPDCDLYIELLSLAFIFQTTLESIPASVPYLHVPERVYNRAPLSQALVPHVGRTRIGCAWQGNRRHYRDHERSIRPEVFASLGAIRDVDWFAFNFGMGTKVPFQPMTPLSPMIFNFSDTTFALSQMDLVITVDTSLVHLAGAMGIPCWALLTHFPDWRWLLGRSDSPWYPTVRLFRQPRPGDWEAVIADVVQAFAAEFGGAS